MNRDELQHNILTVLNNQEGRYPDFSRTVRDIMSLVDQYHPQTSDRPVMLSELRAVVWSVYNTTYSTTTSEGSFRLFGEELNYLGD